MNTDMAHWYVIKVYTKHGGTIVEQVRWEDMRFEIRTKYNWYFNYRAALLQVKYPRYIVQCFWGNEPATGKTKFQLIESKIRAKKSTITKYENLLKKAQLQWDSLFPIQDDPVFKKAVQKINKLKFELIDIESQLQK